MWLHRLHLHPKPKLPQTITNPLLGIFFACVLCYKLLSVVLMDDTTSINLELAPGIW